MTRAIEFIGPIIHTASRPHVYRCDDGERYVVKAPRYPHPAPDLVVEQLAYRLGAGIGAPVPPGAAIVMLDEQAIASARAAGACVSELEPGPASGTRYLADAGRTILWTDAPDHWLRERPGLRLSALCSWLSLGTWALQLLEVPGGWVAMDPGDTCHDGRRNRWASPVSRFPRAAIDDRRIMQEIDEIEAAMSDDAIAAALSALPAEWLVGVRDEWATSLAARRDEMLAPLRVLRTWNGPGRESSAGP